MSRRRDSPAKPVAPELEVLTVPSRAELRRRLPRLVVGLVCLGVGIAMTVEARLGVSPWDVLHQGIARRTDVSFGTVVVGVGLVVLLLWFPLRQRLGIGTVLNVLSVGWIADGMLALIPDTEPLALRWALLVGGILVTGVGIGLYIGSGLGPGPRDGLMTGLAARGLPLWAVRTGLELSALAAGWLLGGDVGVGTVAFALLIGPLGHWFLARLHLGIGGRDPDPAAQLGE